MDHAFGHENLCRLEQARDARGRSIEAIHLVGANGRNAYANCYVANGVVVAPETGAESDEGGLAQLAEAFPDREVIGRGPRRSDSVAAVSTASPGRCRSRRPPEPVRGGFESQTGVARGWH
jgi:hypothetical protein